MPKRTYDTLGVIITRGASPKMENTDMKQFYSSMFPAITPKHYTNPVKYFAAEEEVFRAAKRVYIKRAKVAA